MSFQNCHIAAIGEKNRQVCPHQSPAKIAGDQIRRDRRIKSPGVSLALRKHDGDGDGNDNANATKQKA